MASSVNDIEKVLHLLQQNLDESQNENMTLQAQIEELKDQSKELCKDNDYLRNKMAGIQQDNSIYNNTQSRLETQLYAQEQDINELRKQVQQLAKAKKDAEHKLQLELTAFEADRAAWQQKEVDMFNQIRTLGANNVEPRTPRTVNRRSATLTPFGFPGLMNIGEEENNKPPQPTLSHSSSTSHVTKRNSRLMMDESDSDHDTPKLAAIDSAQVRENKIAQRTIKAQDKLILDLKVELDQQKSIVQDHDTRAQRQSLRIQQLEQEIANVKQVNQSLMEDNESYQILLHEKTISGEFMMNPIMQVETIKSSESSNGGLNLAAELNLANDLKATQKANEVDKVVQKLTDEVKTLQDTNRALQLYMNKILMKIIDNKQLEDVLSIDQPKPIIVDKDPSKIESAPRSAGLGPAPTRTLSSTLLNNKGITSSRQQRRRTISYWGSKAPPPPPSSLPDDDDDLPARRHSTMPSKDNNNGGWAKALRRMSIGWPQTSSTDNDKTITPPASSNEETNLHFPPNMTRSGSSTTSLRVSNELANIQEE
ncbi:hypothetical protein BC941DRAFT_465212 [Chlamydoabsidia padenii]|nr:hypothetical protein BC941DRAFT_465212 [Chlamydoabsidia padenii]